MDLWRYLERVGWHQFDTGLYAEVLAADGYRFHRPARRPEGAKVPKLSELEAKPVEKGEVAIHLAEQAVLGFLQDRANVEVYEWPQRQRHWKNDWEVEEDEEYMF